jgi:hypothetical protein
MKPRSLAALVAPILAAALVAVAAAADRTVPYADLHEKFARVAQLGGGRYLSALTKVSTSDGSMPNEQIRIVIQSAAGAVPVPVASDGTIGFPLRDELLEENPPVSINVAKGKLAMSVTTNLAAPPEQRFRYGLMVEMLDEVEAAFAKQGFLARMMAPDFDGLLVIYAPGTQAHAVVESAAGSERFATGADGRIAIPDRDDWREENPYVQLSAMPLEITLQPD